MTAFLESSGSNATLCRFNYKAYLPLARDSLLIPPSLLSFPLSNGDRIFLPCSVGVCPSHNPLALMSLSHTALLYSMTHRRSNHLSIHHQLSCSSLSLRLLR